MPEDTNPPDGNTQDQEPQTPPNPPSSPPAGGEPATPPAPPSVPTIEPDADRERIERLYHNLAGQMRAYVTAAERYQGHLEQQVRQARFDGRLHQTRVQELEASEGSLREQVDQIQELQERAGRADQAEASLQRLRFLTQYPQIISAVQVQETEDEEGNPVQTRRNPTLELLMSSNLTGDEFQQQVQSFVQTLPTTGQQPPAGPPPEAGSTRPPTPAGTTAAATLRQQAIEAQLEGNWDEAEDLLDRYQNEVVNQAGS